MPNSPIRIGINGFGRIGRLVYRIASEDPSLNVVAINDLVPADNLAYLLKHDTMHGTFGTTAASTEDSFSIDGELTHTYSHRNPADIPWKNHAVDYVLESTGFFTTKDTAEAHITGGGVRRVIISAPTKSPDTVPTFVYKVNDEKYDPATHTVLSNASCTTNCLAPISKVLNDTFGIEEGLMTTIHAVTATQPTQDGPSKKDWRSGRNAYMNIIPSSTGAAKAVALCLPELAGKLTGMAFRVPTADVSCVDLTVRTEKSTSLADINAAMKAASETQMLGVLGYTEEAVVSSDFISDRRSSIYDATACIELSDRFFKLVSWYDNEAGYAARCVDMLRMLAQHDGLLRK